MHVSDIDTISFMVEPLQTRVLYVCVDSAMTYLPVFEELDKVHGKESLSRAILAIQYDVDLFFHNRVLHH
jgi:hypothetical protein